MYVNQVKVRKCRDVIMPPKRALNICNILMSNLSHMNVSFMHSLHRLKDYFFLPFNIQKDVSMLNLMQIQSNTLSDSQSEDFKKGVGL